MVFCFQRSNSRNIWQLLKQILTTFKRYPREENLLFINAWNEWAEGSHLEPCIKWGHSYLEQVRFIIGEHEYDDISSKI
ncbi:glycoside hydrolase family 99-like domain-containing protein [Pinibacter soli]|uniref:glycoside hydrolase family 99-like domain-containing protein n=1 Tax=Pinibacter soli TaxID=3044211 RepID=UPI003CE4D44E